VETKGRKKLNFGCFIWCITIRTRRRCFVKRLVEEKEGINHQVILIKKHTLWNNGWGSDQKGGEQRGRRRGEEVERSA